MDDTGGSMDHSISGFCVPQYDRECRWESLNPEEGTEVAA